MKKFLTSIVISFIMIFSYANISHANTKTITTNGYTIKVIKVISNHISIVEVSYNGIVIRFLWTSSGLARIN